MKKKMITCVLLAGCFSILIIACRKDPDTSIDPQSITFEVPDGWPAPFYTFTNNPLTRDGFELGKKIFFDKRLSRDISTSCGSCHQSFAAFANLDHDVSHGVDDKTGNRNSPGLTNLAWMTSFFWDGGVNHLELQPLNPIQNPLEMDLKIDSVVKRLNADPDYRQRFSIVFGSPDITSQGIFRALAQYMAAMVSADSKYDRYKKGTATLSANELAGLSIFQQECATCHKAPLFTDYSFRNNGLPVNIFYKDSGRAHITGNVQDNFKFKVPSLRNLKFTRPYMHDGRFKTLDEVLDHYDHGIAISPTLDPLLQNGIHLNTQQRSDLLAFLGTLNDSTFVADKRFQENR